MAEVKNENKIYGIGFTGLLQIAFIVLKLIGVINWRWIWVVAPTWIYLALILIPFIILILISRK